MNVVVVESPAKAKTINRYLGPGYTVLASFGHVRDLPPKDGSVRPDEDFAMSWEVDAKSSKRLSDIANALKGADRLTWCCSTAGPWGLTWRSRRGGRRERRPSRSSRPTRTARSPLARACERAPEGQLKPAHVAIIKALSRR